MAGKPWSFHRKKCRGRSPCGSVDRNIYQNQILYCMGRTPLERRRALSSYIRAPRDFDSWFERMDEDGGPRAGYANPNDVEQLRRCGVAQQRAWETVRIRMEGVSHLQARIAKTKDQH